MSLNISFGTLPVGTKYVTKNLIIGARQNWSGLRQLRDEENVSRVIDLRSVNDYKKIFERLYCRLLGLKYDKFPLELMNKKPIEKDSYEKIAQILDANREETIFVHCNSGRHRSLFVAGLAKFKEGTIKTMSDFQKFLAENDFYKLRKKVRLGLKFKLTPRDKKLRTENLDYQKEKFWQFLTSKKF